MAVDSLHFRNDYINAFEHRPEIASRPYKSVVACILGEALSKELSSIGECRITKENLHESLASFR